MKAFSHRLRFSPEKLADAKARLVAYVETGVMEGVE